MPRRMYYWRNTPVGRCRIKIRREMLLTKGYVYYPSQSRNRQEMDLGFGVVYDENYVYDYIAKNLIGNLNIRDKKELARVLSKAWDYYENQFNGKEHDPN